MRHGGDVLADETPTGGPASGPPVGRLPAWLFVPGLGVLAMVTPVATDLWLPAFPEMARDLMTTPASVQLTITTLLVGMAVGQLVIGPLSDRYGRRPLLVAGSVGCALSTAFIALAPTIELILAARVVQGLTGAAGVVLARAMIADVWSGSHAAKNLSVLGVVITIAPVVAPVVGGAFAGTLGWRGLVWGFFGLTVVMVALAALLPETHPERRGDRAPAGGHPAPPTGTSPLDPPGTATTTVPTARPTSLLRRPPFVWAMLVVALGHVSLMAYISAAPFIFREELGLDQLGSGLLFATCSAGLITLNMVNSHTVVRFGARRMLRIGLTTVSTGGLLLLLLVAVGAPPITVVGPIVLLVGSIGLISGNGSAIAIDRARPQVGRASGVIGFWQFLGGGLIAPVVGIWPGRVTLVLAVVVTLASSLAWLAHLAGERLAAP